MKNAWVYLVVAATLAATAAYVAHLRLSEIPDLAIGYSPKPPELGRLREKTIDYEVSGPPGAAVALSYLDENNAVQQVNATLPWRTTLRTHRLTIPIGVTAQASAGQVSCRILVNGQQLDEQSTTGAAASVTCNVVSA
ncbi:MAG: MmpS family transport accessory protein [Segniliparus sp.]|uniref:MmpS family transport accessory protein n=1 Tax=Segniliparus sp. TaxID=2804064 RepID=UPI003F2EBB00